MRKLTKTRIINLFLYAYLLSSIILFLPISGVLIGDLQDYFWGAIFYAKL